MGTDLHNDNNAAQSKASATKFEAPYPMKQALKINVLSWISILLFAITVYPLATNFDCELYGPAGQAGIIANIVPFGKHFRANLAPVNMSAHALDCAVLSLDLVTIVTIISLLINTMIMFVFYRVNYSLDDYWRLFRVALILFVCVLGSMWVLLSQIGTSPGWHPNIHDSPGIIVVKLSLLIIFIGVFLRSIIALLVYRAI